jgi:prepilin-type N-terminal cleavage/methylation domain-containing protein
MILSNRRPGVTLIEVLAAIFIMGVGMLALLTLFPLGALSMAQAIKDDRVAQAAQSAEAVATALDLRHNAAFQNNFLGTPPTIPVLPANWQGPSYPVFVDPLGILNNLPATLGTVGSNRIARMGLILPNFPVNPVTRTEYLRLFTLPDDLTFDEKYGFGAGDGTLLSLQREGRYSVAYLMRRPQAQNNSVVDVSIVVYAGRVMLPGTGEIDYPVLPGTANSVILDYASAGDRPAIRRGTWLLDVTYHDPQKDTLNALQFGPVHGNFYRVVGVTDVTTTQIEVELEPTIKGPISRMVVMENVAEVIQKGSDWLP